MSPKFTVASVSAIVGELNVGLVLVVTRTRGMVSFGGLKRGGSQGGRQPTLVGSQNLLA